MVLLGTLYPLAVDAMGGMIESGVKQLLGSEASDEEVEEIAEEVEHSLEQEITEEFGRDEQLAMYRASLGITN